MIKESVILHSSIRSTWKLFPAFSERVRTFCETYDSDANIEVMEDFLKMSFIARKPTALMIAGLDEKGNVVAHMLCIAEQSFGRPIATVYQLESDQRIPQELWNQAESAIDLFAKAHDAQVVQLAARNQTVSRLFRMKGFKENRIVMRRPLLDGRAG